MSLINSLTSNYIKKFSMENGVDFIGVALPDRFDAAQGNHPKDLFKDVCSIIVLGMAIPIGSLHVSGILYHSTVNIIQLQLDLAAMKICKELEKNGGKAIPVPAHGFLSFWDEEKQYGKGILSIKHAAQAAGLGKIGKSSLFISKDYGVFTRMACILTDVELEPTSMINDWEPCPKDCHLCIDSCPVQAIQPNNLCNQSLCRENIFKKTMRGDLVEDCRECIKACPWSLKRTSALNSSRVERLDIGSKINKSMNRKKISIATLGPSGTCSEYASEFFIDKNNYDGTIILYSSFEEAAEALKAGKTDYIIVPSAYRNLATIVFQEQRFIEIEDVFKLKTPSLVIADRGDDKKIQKVATHSSPSILARNYYPDAELIISKSNSNSAEMLLANEVDACVTTMCCVDKYSLHIIHDFGGIIMGWNVLKRKKN